MLLQSTISVRTAPSRKLRQCRPMLSVFYECTGCGIKLKPKAGDCCVFCSYGSCVSAIQAVRSGEPGAAPAVRNTMANSDTELRVTGWARLYKLASMVDA